MQVLVKCAFRYVPVRYAHSPAEVVRGHGPDGQRKNKLVEPSVGPRSRLDASDCPVHAGTFKGCYGLGSGQNADRDHRGGRDLHWLTAEQREQARQHPVEAQPEGRWIVKENARYRSG
ncbi:MAG: hypothetical protein OXI63_20690 [Candidatus Poribacteria bacterium]|nr:hypothetical protein [Candidatus Poribacteria bacterium]